MTLQGSMREQAISLGGLTSHAGGLAGEGHLSSMAQKVLLSYSSHPTKLLLCQHLCAAPISTVDKCFVSLAC